MFKLLRVTFAATVLIIAAAYVADYGVLRYRIVANRNPFGNVTVRTFYAIPQKNRSTGFLPGDARQDRCVHSLFPHMNDAPCWYLIRHKEQQINM